MTDFSKLLIKQYKNWGVYIHENQGYLGRCVIWCDREDAEQLTDATKEEQEELFVILRELRKASEKAFEGNWFNFSFLGNETRHLHAHFIPRYVAEREFEGTIFKDPLWGHNYKTDHSFITPPEVLEKIRLRMKECLVKNDPTI